MLESAALGVTFRGASAAADRIEALGPLGDSLREAGRDLDCQLEAMDEVLTVAAGPGESEDEGQAEGERASVGRGCVGRLHDASSAQDR